MNLNIFSDLRKPGLVPGESLSLNTKFDSVLEKNKFYITLLYLGFYTQIIWEYNNMHSIHYSF